MRKKYLHFLCLASALTITAVSPAYAGPGPGESGDTIPSGVTEEQWSRLNDQKIEFDEVYHLVQYFNPTLMEITDNVNSSLDDMKYIHDGIKSSIRDMRDDAEEMKNSGAANTMEGMIEYMTLKGTADYMSAQAEKMKRSLDILERPGSSAKAAITQYTKQFTYYANQVMIGYSSATANQAMLEKMVEASQAGLDAQKRSLTLGMVTEADVLSAEKGLLTAQSSLMQLNNTIDGLKRSLCLMTGYSTDQMPEIGSLPEMDFSIVDSIDLQADTQKAINNNYSLISERHNSAKSTAKKNTKDASLDQNTQVVAVKVQSLYQALRQAKNAYEAACVSYERAALEKGRADRSRQMGMVSDIAYLQSQMAFLQAEGTKQNAYNTLYQAYDTYKWAVDGILMD